MNTKVLGFALSCVALAACTTSNHIAVNQPIGQTAQISPVIAQAAEKSLKRVVAISRFSDETKRGNGFFVDGNNNRIGKQASDILAARLTDTGKFIMLERSDLAAVAKESQFDKSELATAAADYLIIGSVSEYGRTTNSEVGIFSRNKIQKANVTVNIRLVNTKTAQVVYAEEATGEASSEANHVLGVGERSGYDASLDDKALSAAVSKLVSNVMENLLDSPWQAYLLAQQESHFLMSGGKDQGIKLGDEFQVMVKGKQIKNPQTGLMIELPATKVAAIKVLNFAGTGANAVAVTAVVSGQIDNTKLNDYVVREL